MKTLFSISLITVLLLGISLSAPPPVQADSWVDDLISCTGGYMNAYSTAWGVFDASPKGPSDYDLRDYTLDQGFNNFQACNSVVNIPYAAIDYCPAAYAAYASCQNQFQGLEATPALMECQAATGYMGRCL